MWDAMWFNDVQPKNENVETMVHSNDCYQGHHVIMACLKTTDDMHIY